MTLKELSEVLSKSSLMELSEYDGNLKGEVEKLGVCTVKDGVERYGDREVYLVYTSAASSCHTDYSISLIKRRNEEE